MVRRPTGPPTVGAPGRHKATPPTAAMRPRVSATTLRRTAMDKSRARLWRIVHRGPAPDRPVRPTLPVGVRARRPTTPIVRRIRTAAAPTRRQAAPTLRPDLRTHHRPGRIHRLRPGHTPRLAERTP